MTRKANSGQRSWLTVAALALLLGLASACALNTAPNTIPEPDDDGSKERPTIGSVMPPGVGTAVLV